MAESNLPAESSKRARSPVHRDEGPNKKINLDSTDETQHTSKTEDKATATASAAIRTESKGDIGRSEEEAAFSIWPSFPDQSASGPSSSSQRDQGNGEGGRKGDRWQRAGRPGQTGREGRGNGGKKGGKEYKGQDKRNLLKQSWQRDPATKTASGENGEKGKASQEGGEKGAEGDVDGEGRRRLPKKKVAILLGYCGAGYSGMQIQTHGSRTIEGDFFEALVKAGAVSEENSVDHRKVDVQRAARTDAGVHAAGNCISLKMIVEPPLPPEHKTLASYVNSFLPGQIRMWGFVRTMKSFQARLSCDSRIYEYVLPSYCLLPPASSDPLAKQLDESSPGWREGLGEAAEFVDAGISAEEDETAEKAAEVVEQKDAAEGERPERSENNELRDPKTRGEFERRRGWRVDKETLERFRALIAQYKGTHNFHNYTVGKPFNDKTVKRFMMKLTVRDPQVVGDIEWISVQIHGQSFMLHQIRKMLSLAILACRTNTPPSLIPETFGPMRIHIPKAPPLGLLLEAPQFGSYNSKINGHIPGTDTEREPIDWSIYQDEIQEFRLKFIYEKLRQDELDTHVFHKWLRQMDCTSSKMLSFLNTKGIIPREAQVTPGRASDAGKGKKDVFSAENGQGTKDGVDSGMESEDEEVDQELLKKGELEG